MEYTPFLLIDGVAGVIYGGGYQAVINNPDETAMLQLTQQIRALR